MILGFCRTIFGCYFISNTAVRYGKYFGLCVMYYHPACSG